MSAESLPLEIDLQPRRRVTDTARRRFRFLCLALILLGFADAARVLIVDRPILDEPVAQARENLEAAQDEYERLRTSAATDAEAKERFENTDSAVNLRLAQAEAALEAAQSARANLARRLLGTALGMVLVGWFLWEMSRRPPDRATRLDVVRTADYMLLIVGVVALGSRLLVQRELPGAAAFGIFDIMAIHVVAALILPWSGRESLLPFVPLLVLWWLVFLFIPLPWEMDGLTRVVLVIVSPISLAPGFGIAAWRWRVRQENLERRQLGDQVESFDKELIRARTVHDAMFPKPVMDHACFDYVYQPMQEIGGDYVHLDHCPRTGRIIVTLLDVAGHGLAAALTVNRLFGELERILAEDRDAGPSQIMSLLNRYIYLTMARHSLFATGCCLMIDPVSGELSWVNAGHPPAMLRRANGEVMDLETTTMLLGVLDPESWEPELRSMRLDPGDVVIAYTDGAFEARDASGRKLGIGGLRELVRFDPPPRNWPRFIATAVKKHHGDDPEDDVLIAALTLRSRRVD